jgi:phage terminase small subunit
MGARGKTSAAALAVAAPVAALQKMPEPPAYLTPEEDHEWRRVVASRAGDLIQPEAYRLLVEYCRAVVLGDKIAAQLDAFDPSWVADDDGLKRWDRLQAMAARNQGVIATLATKLRIATSSSVRAENATTVLKKGTKRKPWEFADEG